jgi:virginiamycin B lyase
VRFGILLHDRLETGARLDGQAVVTRVKRDWHDRHKSGGIALDRRQPETAMLRYRFAIVMWLGCLTLCAGVLSSSRALAQTFTEFPVPRGSFTAGTLALDGITTGSDGALWFAMSGLQTTFANGIGRITTSGAITSFPALASFDSPHEIAPGPDGALWFTEPRLASNGGPNIGKITTAGGVTEFQLPFSGGLPQGMTTGPDGALWFGLSDSPDNKAASIGRVTTAGTITSFEMPTTIFVGLSIPARITTGPDGALWFTSNDSSGTGLGKIGRITVGGAFSGFPISTTKVIGALGITAGPDGALWFTENEAGKVGRITTSGTVTEFSLGSTSTQPRDITVGPDGALWFTQLDATTSHGAIGRITTDGQLSEFQPPTGGRLFGITTGPDGNIWATNNDNDLIVRFVPPTSTAPLLAAVLPSSRSVQVGATATAFATIINTSTSTASACGIVPTTSIPASFLYQTTDPSTNALTGSVNTPTNIGAGVAQSFVIAFTPTAPFVPGQVVLGFDCANVAAAPINFGLNTLLLSGSATPVPDIVALAASGDPGIVDIPGTNAAGAFAVATVNVGASATITATANTGSATLPVTITLCQTNPSTGQCLAPPTTNATTAIASNATPTFGIFVSGSGSIPFNPAGSRIFVQFADSSGVVHGSTSVAVRTQ